MENDYTTRCGFTALAGRPNVGKSTLLNALVGGKVSIVSPKVQTTRHRIRGVRTQEDCQWVFVDMPGLHEGGKKALNRHLNKTALASIADVDLIVQVIEADRWTRQDERVLQHLREVGVPLALVLNKIDRLPKREQLLPFIEKVNAYAHFEFILPLSALKEDNVTQMLDSSAPYLPRSPFLFPEEQTTDRGESFQVAETIREKLVMTLHQELPYAVTVTADSLRRERGTTYIHATIWVERENQKPIVIGHRGQVLKEVGTRARKELEKRLGGKFHIRLWVKVRRDWSKDEKIMQSLGLDNLEL